MKTTKIEIIHHVENYGKIILSKYKRNSVLSLFKVETAMLKEKQNSLKVKTFTLLHNKKKITQIRKMVM